MNHYEELNKKILFKNSKTTNDIGLLIFRLTLGLVLLWSRCRKTLCHFKWSGNPVYGSYRYRSQPVLLYGCLCRRRLCNSVDFRILLSFCFFSTYCKFYHDFYFFHALIIKDGFEVLELRFLYLLPFIALTFTGAGRFSLDDYFFKKRINKNHSL